MSTRVIPLVIIGVMLLGCSATPKIVKLSRYEDGVKVIDERVFDQSKGREISRSSYYLKESGEKVLHGTSVFWKKWSSSGMNGIGRVYINGTYVREVNSFVEY